MKRILLLLTAMGAVGAFAVFVGFEISERRLPTYGLLRQVDRIIADTVTGKDPAEPGQRTFNTALIMLVADFDQVELDVDTRDVITPMVYAGGGMTSFGEDLLLLPYDGHVYAARFGQPARRVGIDAPDNGRDAYLAVTRDPARANLVFEPYYLRYNDIKHFETAGRRGLLASYSEYHADGLCTTNTVARLDFPPTAASIDDIRAGSDDWQIIYRSSPCLPFKTRLTAFEGHMAGGRMLVVSGGTVLLANGDFHHDGMRSNGAGLAQAPDNEYGKVVSIDFMTGEHRVVSSGHRNPQGIAADAAGRIFIAEHGPKGGDELNLLVEGANFGWPLESYGTTYSDQKLPASLSYGRHETHAAPVFAWIPSPAISALALVSPGFHEAWEGDLIATSMMDRALHRIRFADGRPVYSETIPLEARIRHIHQHTDGHLALWTDNHQIIWLSGMGRDNVADSLKAHLAQRKIPGDVARSVEQAVLRCVECHSFQVGDHGRSPSLARIFGQDIGTTEFESYSDALKEHGGQWTAENLQAFLTDPQGFSPGTTMPGVLEEMDPREVGEIVAFLQAFSNQF